MNFDIIPKAHLTQLQFADLVGVSRVTVNTWVKGKFSPRSNLRDRVLRALDLIAKAVDAGKLPVAVDGTAEKTRARLATITTALNKPGK